MPHEGSLWATVAKVSLAFSYQKEWSMATALLNCDWTAGLQETGKFTLPSFAGSPAGCSCSCWATAGATNVAQTAISMMEIKVNRFMRASPISYVTRRPTVAGEGFTPGIDSADSYGGDTVLIRSQIANSKVLQSTQLGH